jgi:multiple sugar transport system substrate-binding protein
MSDARGQSQDPGETTQARLTRRRLLVTGATGAAAAYGLSAGGAAARGLSSSTWDAVAADTVTFGSNYSDAVPKKAMQAVLTNFTKKTGIPVKVNTVTHNTFQEQINSYLQGKPDDVFTWFAGYRMQFFAQKGLASPLDDVWKVLTPQMPSAFKGASTGLDGHQYFVPMYNYPWALFYRKSLFKEKGYTIPKTWVQLIALAKKMKADGLTPIAFADKDGWPAMGTFDILNMRLNGYQFHVDLMAGKKSWNSPQVKAVFNTWRQLLPYNSAGALGLTWQEAAQQLLNKQAGMYLLGSFVGEQFTDAADHADLDFFAYPSINPKWGQDSIDAPIDGFMMSKSPKNPAGAKALLTYLGSAAAADTFLASSPNNVGANKGTNKAKYTSLQKKAAALIAGSKHIAQYLDRDTRPDFASTVMIPSLQQFLNNPNDVNSLVASIQKQKVAIFGS